MRRSFFPARAAAGIPPEAPGSTAPSLAHMNKLYVGFNREVALPPENGSFDRRSRASAWRRYIRSLQALVQSAEGLGLPESAGYR